MLEDMAVRRLGEKTQQIIKHVETLSDNVQPRSLLIDRQVEQRKSSS
jgi:hypothetical protein